MTKPALTPCCLLLKTKSNQTPQVLIEEIRGVGSGGEYLVYSPDEAARLGLCFGKLFHQGGHHREEYRHRRRSGARVSGALIGLLSGGNDLIWKGALIGTAAGGLTGAAVSAPNADGDLKYAVRQEMHQYAWQQSPLPPHYTRTGYLYFPNVGIYKIKVTVRTDRDISSYEIPVDMPPPGQPAY